MAVLRKITYFTTTFFLILFLQGCQISYILKSANNQFSMMASRKPIKESLNDPNISEENKRKLALSQQAKLFAINELKLKNTENYNTYIDLKRPYVTWVVHAAQKWELKNYEWPYPFLGRMPYKGFFNEADAKSEAHNLENEGLDTFVRGVSAYSTLGYFTDSVLSSMLRYKDHDLVNTIIHETVHTTIYIKNNADFNERLAVFIGNKGTEIFYKNLEGENSPTLQIIQSENNDDQLFSDFITQQLKDLDIWYAQNPQQNETYRLEQFEKIKTQFKNNLANKLKTKNYNHFLSAKLNNAYLGLYKTYMQDLKDFETVFDNSNKNLIEFINKMKNLEQSKDPVNDLKKLADTHKNS